MAKPIKKGKSRISSGFNGKQIGGLMIGILFFATIVFGVYWMYHNTSATNTVTNNGVSSIQKFISDNGIQTTGILVVVVGGLLYTFIFNKK
jgi:hypothetical protein